MSCNHIAGSLRSYTVTQDFSVCRALPKLNMQCSLSKTGLRISKQTWMDMVTHSCNPSTLRRLRQEDPEFKASLGSLFFCLFKTRIGEQ